MFRWPRVCFRFVLITACVSLSLLLLWPSLSNHRNLISVHHEDDVIPPPAYHKDDIMQQSVSSAVDPSVVTPKVILMWTNIFSQPISIPYMDECSLPPEKRCIIVTDRSRLREASAVVFHARDINMSVLPPPDQRQPNQLFVFHIQEVPSYVDRAMLTSFPSHYFNVSMTYRRDSDIPFPYGNYWTDPEETKRLGLTPVSLPSDEDAIMDSKGNKSIFWLVSNCETPSKRELAVKKLWRYIDVDVFGKCSHNETMRDLCPRESNCEKRMATEYHFFIAAENTVCKDYITEKYWSRYEWPTVPIVMRRRVYEGLVPSNSFIAMDDFASAMEMADYLKGLMANRTAYMEYFAWRSQGWAIHPYQQAPHRVKYCSLCDRLNSDNVSSSSIEDIVEWFYGPSSECETSEFADSWPHETSN